MLHYVLKLIIMATVTILSSGSRKEHDGLAKLESNQTGPDKMKSLSGLAVDEGDRNNNVTYDKRACGITEDECKNNCLKRDDCHSASYNAAPNGCAGCWGYGHCCWLKTFKQHASDKLQKGGCSKCYKTLYKVSGGGGGMQELGGWATYTPGEMAAQPNLLYHKTKEQCKEACSGRSDCMSASYNPTNGRDGRCPGYANACFLKTTVISRSSPLEKYDSCKDVYITLYKSQN